MFGFLKNILRKTQDTTTDSTSSPTIEAAAPVVPASSPTLHQSSFRSAPIRKNLGQQNGNGKSVEVSLQKILAGLPLELQSRIRQGDVGEQTISVPLEKILAQLSRGAVKVSFGELRQAAPGVFTAENDRDRVLVALPLADILSQLNPALITRRRVQRQIEVPADISSPFDPSRPGGMFGGDDAGEAQSAPPAIPSRQVNPPFTPATPGRGGLASVPPPPQPAGSPISAARPPVSLKANPNLAAPAAAPLPIAKAPAVPRPAPRPVTPPVVPAAGTPTVPTSLASSPPAPPLPRLTPPAPPVTTATPKAPAPLLPVGPGTPAPSSGTRAPIRSGRENNGEQTTTLSPATGSAPAPKPVPAGEPLILAMGALAEVWPDAVRKEILDLNLAEAKVAMPAQAVEQALKQGRIAFTWKTIRSWVKPAVPATASPNDGRVLDLPLKVVAPLFLARQRQANKAQQKVSVDEDIPNLFFGHPQQETETPVAAATARPTDTNYYVWDDSHDTVLVHESEVKRPTPGTKFVAKYATPNEVVSRAAALDGVAGALIALPDGLMVANRLPPDLNADTLAAFLPQIFGKVSQCTKELRMGELNNLNFTVGNVPWKIFRVNAIFFAAFGREGEPLPTAQLAALAAELDHKPK
jgi:predicted regulator of Ras-like GTPase activity (Roadblock/LC7/MglB family)